MADDSPLLPDTGEPGFGVYVHWPFCAAKCPYCDFNSHVRHQAIDQDAFVAAFLKEMTAMRTISGSVFIHCHVDGPECVIDPLDLCGVVSYRHSSLSDVVELMSEM